MSSQPPLYDLDFPIPDYSFEPRADEERLEYQIPSWQQYDIPRPTGVLIRRQEGITIVLNNQEDKATTPVYRQRSNVEGSLVIDSPKSVSEVIIKLSARIEAVSPSGGGAQIKLFDQTYSLFKSDSDERSLSSHSSMSDSEIPNPLQFSCPLPPTFEYTGKRYPLPPSCYFLFPSGQGQAYYAKCTYQFTALVSKTRPRHTAFLGKSHKANAFTFEYLPRIRPPRPVIDRSLLSTIKTQPEEWRQFSYQMVFKDKHHQEPLTCQLFLPSIGVYGLTDYIPFHVQIVGSDASLSNSKTRSSSESKPPVRVHILRQLAMETNGQKNVAHLPFGEAELYPLPPLGGAISLSDQTPVKQGNINWEGNIRFQLQEQLVPSFNAGVVAVTDFVILELSKWHTKVFQPFRHVHPVRLVSDSQSIS